MTDQLPAPKFSIEMNSCNCKKTNCLGNRCSCAKNGLRCTDLCKCISCENEDMRFTAIDDEHDNDEHNNIEVEHNNTNDYDSDIEEHIQGVNI